MKIDQYGIKLWSGTTDAPAPSDFVLAGKSFILSIGVQPADSTTQVFIYFKINGKSKTPILCSPTHADTVENVQYFQAEMPPLNEGDELHYALVCHSNGIQVPEYKNKLELPMAVRAVSKSEYESNGTIPSGKKQESVVGLAEVKEQDTVIAPEVENPAASGQADDYKPGVVEKKLNRAAILKKVLPQEMHEKFDQAVIEHGGNIRLCKKCLKHEAGLDKQGVKTFNFTHRLAKLSGDHEPLISRFQQNEQTNSLSDIAQRFNRKKLKEEIRKTGIPPYVKGKDEESRLNRYTNQVSDKLFFAATTTVVRRMLHESEMSTEDHNTRRGAAKALDNVPGFDLRSQSIYLLIEHPEAFKGVPEEHHEQVKEFLKTVQHLVQVSPNEEVMAKLINLGFNSAYAINEIPANSFVTDYSEALGGKRQAKVVHDRAQQVNQRNEQAYFSMRDMAFGPSPQMVIGGKSPEARKEAIMKYAHDPQSRKRKKAGKSKVKSLHKPPEAHNPPQKPEELRPKPRPPKQQETAAKQVQPDILSSPAKVGSRHAPVKRQRKKKERIPINWQTLFGSEDHCAVKHCESLYSPAAYLVELFQYLRNNNLDPEAPGALKVKKRTKDISDTPLEKLFERRPDLGRLKLTCANTEVTLPYIDLVNEIMESYVDYLHKKKQHPNIHKHIPVYNVKDESDAQLLAEPHHTNYAAYQILKDEVYPATALPYHQAIDAIREYSAYLGTSRYELMDTFRSKIKTKKNPPNIRRKEIDLKYTERFEKVARLRALDAEYLNLTEEEYIILTKNAFLHKNLHTLRRLNAPNEHPATGQQEESHPPEHPQLPHKPGHEELRIPGHHYEPDKQQDPKDTGQHQNVHKPTDKEPLPPGHHHELHKPKPLGRHLAKGQGHKKQYRKAVGKKPVHVYYGYHSKDEMRRNLKWVKPDPKSEHSEGGGFLARTGLQYAELLELLKTRFVNPNYPSGKALYLFNRAEGNYLELKELVDHAGSDHKAQHAKLVHHLKGGKEHSSRDIECLVNRYFHRIGKAITLESKEPDDTCDLSKVKLQHLDGSDLETWEYSNMHRFIRLYKKMGWSMDELDRAILSVGTHKRKKKTPKSSTKVKHNRAGLRPLVKTKGQHKVRQLQVKRRRQANRKVLKRAECNPLPALRNPYRLRPSTIQNLAALKKLQTLTGQEITKLLLFWNDFSVKGEKSLYHRLFLEYNIVGLDKVFVEDKYGNFLTKETPIKKHLPVLMAAFRVNSEQIRTILRFTGLMDANLTLRNISVLYRYILIAKMLNIRVEHLSMTIKLLAPQANPFKNPKSTLRFFKIYNRITEAGFKPTVLSYIIQGKDDKHRPLKPTPRTLLQHAVSIRNAIEQIEGAHPDLTNDVQATDEFLRSKLGLIFNQQTSEQILALLNGKFTSVDTTRRQITKKIDSTLAESIEQFLLDKRASLKKAPPDKSAANTPDSAVALNGIDKYQNFLQRVQFKMGAGFQVTGILNEEDMRFFAEMPGITEYEVAIRKILNAPEMFLNQTLGAVIRPNQSEAEKILLMPDKDSEVSTDKTGTSDPGTPGQKRAYFARIFLPYLREQLCQRQIAQLISGAIRLDLDSTNLLLHSIFKSKKNKTAYQNIIQLKENSIKTDPESGEWKGYLCPQQSGIYRLLMEVENFDKAITRTTSIKINGKPLWVGPLGSEPDEEGLIYFRSRRLRLKAGEAYEITINDYDKDDSTGKIIGLFWKFSTKPQEPIPTSVLYEEVNTNKFRKIYTRLQKAALVISGFNLNAEELEFLHEKRTHFSHLNFRKLTLRHWLRLEAYTRLRNQLPQTNLSLLEFLNWAHDPDNDEKGIADQKKHFQNLLAARVSKLINRKKIEIKRLIGARSFSINAIQYFRNEKNLLKLLQMLKVADRIGIDIKKLFAWAKPNSEFKYNRRISRSMRNAIRARYSRKEWEQAIRPVHDKLRENKKQALIAHLLVQPELRKWGVIDADSLFEYFLIDVQMDACMDTSRIVQAIAAVQLFIQRCMLGLEKRIPAKLLDWDRWQWMSHYRVWEANRKVFLYPENWIEPELRDDKSPFFKELESELMQNDISAENVKNALVSYLHKVDEVANLEVVGLYMEGTTKRGKLHIFARTNKAPYFFYYRNFDTYEQNWLPWEKMEVDITSYDVENTNKQIVNNGCYLIPVVWKNRLMVFFPQFIKKTIENRTHNNKKIKEIADEKMTDVKPFEYWEIKMAFSEYKKGKWTQKQVSPVPVYSMAEHQNKISILSDIHRFSFFPFIASKKVSIRIGYTGPNFLIFPIPSRHPGPIQPIYLPQRFEFDGEQLKAVKSKAERIVSSLPANFHVSGNQLYSLQVNKGKTPNLYRKHPYWNKKRTINLTNNSNKGEIKFYHPHTNVLVGLAALGNLEELFAGKKIEVPLNKDNYGLNKPAIFHELKSPYAIYNWELLFHSVMLIANKLNKSQRFEEAMQWYHYIFNPINPKNKKDAWRFQPYQKINAENALEKFLRSLHANKPDKEINAWRNQPFMPHLIARGRPVAYMHRVVMEYIDNLIDWADALFRRDTRETINQATQLYILASHILGPRPEVIPRRKKLQPKSYLELLGKWDAFGNAVSEMSLLFPHKPKKRKRAKINKKSQYGPVYGIGAIQYFGIPHNPKLMGYWDTVADRLYKIRHCLNIEGVFRKLSLFDPEIDPSLLVRAAAQGLSLSSVLNDLNSPMPNYRFTYLLQRALELTNEVKALGNALLSALEKKDNEAIGLLRSRQDIRMQNLVMEIKKQQLEEAEKSLEALHVNRKSPEYRLQYYQQLTGNDVAVPGVGTDFKQLEDRIEPVKDESGLKLISFEKEEMDKAKQSAALQLAAGTPEILAGILYAIPMLKADVKPLGVGAGAAFGGTNLGQLTQTITKALQITAGYLSHQSSSASRKGGFLRALQDRIFQANLAGFELKQIDCQITTQQIRVAMANMEIKNQQVSIDNAQEVDDFLRNKYTNDELYNWMIGQIKTNYYQVYTMAYDLAKKAEKVFRFEKGITDTNYIQFGYWDSGRNGLLAGEGLFLALKQLEKAYIETREYNFEITKHVSLLQLNPMALIQLKETGVCEFDIPELLFDMDYPGHYKRRIKTAALSIPCVVGPYTGLNCTLRLQKHEYRNTAIAGSGYPKKLEESDERFITNIIPINAIAVSQGQNDSGVFELNFRDERYMPFEGAGAISTWRLELPNEFRQFDYDTISDVILHLRYTASEGGQMLKTAATKHVTDFVKSAEELSRTEGLFRMISLRHEMPGAWHRFSHPVPGETPTLELGNLFDRLPFYAKFKGAKAVSVDSVWIFVQSGTLPLELGIKSSDAFIQPTTAAPVGQLKGYLYSEIGKIEGEWEMRVISGSTFDPDGLKDMVMVVRYQIKGN